MISPGNLRRADLLAGSALMLLGAAVVIESLGMPLSGTYGGRPIYWYTSPAFFPILLGVALIGLSVNVVANAIKAGAHQGIVRFAGAKPAEAWRSPPFRRGSAVLGLLGGYIALLALHPFAGLAGSLERIPGVFGFSVTRFLAEPEGVNYVVSSALFLAAMMFLFWRRTGWVLPIAAGASWAVAWAFAEQLYVPLPW